MLLAVLLTLTAAFAADRSAAPTVVDATLGYVPEMYVPTAKDLAYNGVTAGDVAAGDIRAVGTSLQYTGLVLNGDGVNPDAPHPFLKVQQQGATGSFEYGGCYLGNNSSAGTFGLGFFALSQPFNSAHMLASRTVLPSPSGSPMSTVAGYPIRRMCAMARLLLLAALLASMAMPTLPRLITSAMARWCWTPSRMLGLWAPRATGTMRPLA